MTLPDSPLPQDTIPKVEVEIDPEPILERSLGDRITVVVQQFLRWYDRQASIVKISVAIALIFVTLSILSKVLHLVASLISTAILAVILYGVYRIFLKSKSSPSS
ncbi:MAG: hypothetical protein ACRC6M_19260 [Microcystaceae cyanobacterium]